MDIKCLQTEFPISSQTSEIDKRALLLVREAINGYLDSYNYLEIGSYLGGTLVPFLRDGSCRRILSVDKRGQLQPDERGGGNMTTLKLKSH